MKTRDSRGGKAIIARKTAFTNPRLKSVKQHTYSKQCLMFKIQQIQPFSHGENFCLQ